MRVPQARRHDAAILAASVALLFGSPSYAIIMRHDVDRARYRELGERYRQVLVQLGLPSQQDSCPMLYSGMGTLIAPDWVLTAAHAAKYLHESPATGPNGARYAFVKGRGYRVAQVFVHPDYQAEEGKNDIALLHLAAPVREPAPAALYDKADEAGKVVTLIGTGISGDGINGPGVPDGALLGATVRVDTANGGWLTWVFRKPGDPKATPLEGISGPGDSGGPALLVLGARTYVVGVSGFQRVEIDPNAPPKKGEDPQGRYGVTEVYARVSHYLPWIRDTMSKSN